MKTCPRCGENLNEQGDKLKCPYCFGEYDKNDILDEMTSYFEAEKLALLSNRRRILYDCAHKQFISSNELSRAASDVLNIYAEDTLARFYQASLDSDPSTLNNFLAKLNTDVYIAKEILRFTLRSLEIRNVFALKSFVERHLKGNELLDAYNQIEDEAAKVEDGTYLTNLPRDVFLAYSSMDLPLAIELADFLEDNEFTVFVAVRNMRHGKGAKENYFNALAEAMAHCKTLVFLSTENSRSLNCDATRYELPYIRDNLPNMNRIEYLAEDYGPRTKLAAKTILKSVFKDLEWCRAKEDIVMRLLSFDKPMAAPQKQESAAPKPQKPAENPTVSPKPAPSAATQKTQTAPSSQTTANAAKPNQSKENRAESAQTAQKQSTQQSSPQHGDNADEREIDPNSFRSIFGGLWNKTREAISSAVLKDSEERQAEVKNGMQINKGKLIKYTGNLRSLTLPEGITTIAEYAFSGSKVEAIAFPRTLTSIEQYAFSGCASLRKIAFPRLDKLTIHEYAFHGCINVASLSLTVRSIMIREHAFSGCVNLTGVALVGETIEVCDYAFQGCVRIVKVVAGKTTKALRFGSYAFQGCAQCQVLSIPVGSVTLGDYCFYGATRLVRIQIPPKSKIGYYALPNQ